MANILESVFVGLSLGGVYALVAIGFSFLFGTGRYLNFAHGDWAMFGGMWSAAVVGSLGIWFGALLAPVAGVAIGGLNYFFLIRLSRSRDVLSLSFLLLAGGLVLEGLALVLWGADSVGVGAVALLQPIRVGGAVITQISLVVLGVSVLALVCLAATLNLTRIGRAMTAWAENPEAAALCGIDVHRVTLLAFALAGFLAGVAGFLILLETGLNFQVGLLLTIKGFGACALGGFKSPFRAVAGAVVLGMIEAFSATYIGGDNSQTATLLVVFVLLVVVARRYRADSHGADAEVTSDAVNL
jgi:branched-chain amino acid transport system permease protein